MKPEAARKSYAWLKSRGICTKCGREYAEPNKTLCFECAEKHRARERKRYAENAEQLKQYQKDRRAKLKAAGTCIYCGQRPVFRKYQLCYFCHIKQLQSDRAYREKHNKNFREAGLCLRCGAERVEGHYFCAAHLEMARASAAKASAIAKEAGFNRPWSGFVFGKIQENGRRK